MNTEDLVALVFFMLGISGVVFYSFRKSTEKNRSIKEKHSQEVIELQSAEEHLQYLSKINKYFTITSALIGVSIIMALISKLGSSTSTLALFFIASPGSTGFQNILNGEWWRLITPIFIHFGIIHLLFNMMWLWDLGSLTEKKRGHLFICKFVLAVGVSANLAEFLLSKTAQFGGMSGVVYGFLGYLWMQGKYYPNSGIMLHKQTVVWMISWFVLCWAGFLGPIANWAHTAGLGLGMVIGIFDSNAKENKT